MEFEPVNLSGKVMEEVCLRALDYKLTISYQKRTVGRSQSLLPHPFQTLMVVALVRELRRNGLLWPPLQKLLD